MATPIKYTPIDYDNLSNTDKERYRIALRALLNHIVEVSGSQQVQLPDGTIESDISSGLSK